MSLTAPDLLALAREAMARFNALPPEERARHRRLQRESFIRGMTTPCEHGILDFEQCGDCRTPTQGDGDD